MDLSKRLGFDADLLKVATQVLEGKKTEPKEEKPKPIKEEAVDEFIICVIDRHGKESFLEGFKDEKEVLHEASKLRKSGSWRKVQVVNLAEFQDTTGITRATTPSTSLAGRVSRFLGRRAAGVLGVTIPDNNTPDSNQEREALRQAMTPDQRARYDAEREQNIRDTAARETPNRETLDIEPRREPEPEAQTQTQPEPREPDNNLPPPPPEPPARQEPQQQRTAAPAATPRREAPRAQNNDNVADRLNAISLGQTVADRGGTPEADAAPRDDKERDAADNMRRRRNELANEEVEVKKEKKKLEKEQKSQSPGVIFNPTSPAVNEEVGGKIKSSKRITKALQDIIAKGQAKDFKFEDGTSVKIEPSMARIALQKYNALSDFQKAQAAKTMRNSYKEFLAATRGH